MRESLKRIWIYHLVGIDALTCRSQQKANAYWNEHMFTFTDHHKILVKDAAFPVYFQVRNMKFWKV